MVLIVFICAAAAFALSAVCGGGAGLLLLPLLTFCLPVAQAPAALSVGSLASSLARLWVFRRQVDWKMAACFVPAAIPAAIAGALLLCSLDTTLLSLIMGCFLVGNLPFLFRKQERGMPVKRPSGWLLAPVGLVAGFLSGLTGAVGLLFNGIYFRYGLSREKMVATRAANEVLLHAVKLALYLHAGLFSSQSLRLGITVALAGAVSSLLARHALKGISERLFRKIGYATMVLSGFVMLFQSGRALASRPEGNAWDQVEDRFEAWLFPGAADEGL